MQLLISVSDGGLIAEIVSVQLDSHKWGRAELMSRWLADGRQAVDFPGGFFAVARLTGVPVDQSLAGPTRRFGSDELVLPKLNTTVHKRSYYLDLAMLPDRIRVELWKPGGEADLDPSLHLSAIKPVEIDEPEDDDDLWL